MKRHVALAVVLLVAACGGSNETRELANSVSVDGAIAFGGDATLDYTGHPRFSALKISAKAGDKLSATIRSTDGVPVALLLDASYKTLAAGRDADTSEATQKLDATFDRDGTYFIAVRDQDVYTATFRVSVAQK